MSSETINPANAPTLQKSKSLGVAKIESKEVYITGANHNRGQPTQYTPKHLIGEDGKTDYYTVTIETPVELEYKEEGKIPIDTFFVTETIYQQIERIPNALEGLQNGARFGPGKGTETQISKDRKPILVSCL